MTATIPPTAVDPAPNGGRPLLGLPAKVVAGALALAIAALTGYGVGNQHGDSGSHILTGRAYVGDGEAGLRVDGRSFGFFFSQNSLQWYDAQGGVHEGGVPPCLQGPPGHYVWIRFGYSTGQGLHGGSWRSVDWVQCVARHP